MINKGDTFTLAGVYQKIPNPARRWWKPWLPRMVATDELQKFVAKIPLRIWNRDYFSESIRK